MAKTLPATSKVGRSTYAMDTFATDEIWTEDHGMVVKPWALRPSANEEVLSMVPVAEVCSERRRVTSLVSSFDMVLSCPVKPGVIVPSCWRYL